MTDYIAYKFLCEPRQPLSEILTSELADLGFDSFVDTAQGVEAYIPAYSDNEMLVRSTIDQLAYLGTLAYNRELIPGQNWNAEWERSYPRVEVNERCIIRAPFHESEPGIYLELVIAPQMSFGTGHHHTTRLMMEMILDDEPVGLQVLDMGTGTGVLAIACALLGAEHVHAVDIEAWACDNARENALLNNVKINVDKGGAERAQAGAYDLILANINKNVLCQDMQAYALGLKQGGTLMLSGFFTADMPEISASALKYGLKPNVQKENKGWAALKLIKDP